jgi:hypothetical protein
MYMGEVGVMMKGEVSRVKLGKNDASGGSADG